MKRKILRYALSVGLIALAFMLVSCSETSVLSEEEEDELESQSSESDGLSEKTDEEVVTIKFVVKADDADTLDTIINQFNETHSYIVVEPIKLSGTTTEIYEKLDDRLKEQSTAYDIVAIDSIWCQDFIKKGYLRPLDEMIYNENIFIANYNQNLVTIGSYDGFTFGLPYYVDVGFLYYRKDIVSEEDQNILINGAYDYNDLLEMSKKYQEGNDISKGFIFSAIKNEDLTCNLNEFSSNFEEIDNGLSFMRAFVEADMLSDEILTYNQSKVNQAFLNGQSIFARGWTSLYRESKQKGYAISPSMIGYAPLPYTNTFGGSVVGISRFSENKEASEVFLNYLTGQIGQKINGTVGGYVPGYIPLFDDADVQTLNPLMTSEGFLNALEDSSMRPIEENYKALSSDIQNATFLYLNEEMSIDEASKKIEEALLLIDQENDKKDEEN